MITNNDILNQYINNLKAACADVIIAAHEEVQSGKCDYNRLIELNTMITDYANFINLTNMNHIFPKSVKDSSKKEKHIGDIFYVVGVNSDYNGRKLIDSYNVFKCKIAKIADKGHGLYYTLKGVNTNYVHNYKDSSFGKLVFEDYESAEKLLIIKIKVLTNEIFYNDMWIK